MCWHRVSSNSALHKELLSLAFCLAPYLPMSKSIDKLLEKRMDMDGGEDKQKRMSKNNDMKLEDQVQNLADQRNLGQPVLMLNQKHLSSGFKYFESLSCDLLFTILSVCDPVKYNVDKWTELLEGVVRSSHAHKTVLLAEFNAKIGTQNTSPLPTKDVFKLISALVLKHDEKHGIKPKKEPEAATQEGASTVNQASPPKEVQPTVIVELTKVAGGTKKKRLIVPDSYDLLKTAIQDAFGAKNIKELEDADGCSVDSDQDVNAIKQTLGLTLKCVEVEE